MENVSKYIKCPICKSEICLYEYLYFAGGERIFCFNCWYKISFFYRRDEKENLIKMNKTQELTIDSLTSEEFIVNNPFGLSIFEFNDGSIDGAAFDSEYEYASNVLDIILFLYKDPNFKKVTIYRFVDGKITKESF